MARIDKLDSIRGIAAMAVVFGHCWGSLPPPAPGSMLSYVAASPLALLRDGLDAVVVFFILSGLVLAPPFLTADRRQYWPFVVRRVCRIWIPFAVVLVLATALYLCLDLTPARQPEVPFSPLDWRPIPRPALFLRNLLMVDNELNPPMWTLIQEMRISLVFPFLMILVARLPWLPLCLLALAFSFAASASSWLGLDGLAASAADTGRWVCFFVFGAAIARHRGALVAWFERLRAWQKVGLTMVGLILMYPATRQLLANDDTCLLRMRWLGAAGAALVFVVAVNSARVGRFLERRPLVALGRVSYGVFLVHAPVLIIATSVAVRPLPFAVAVALVPVAAVALAALLYRTVELPAIGLGHRLSRRWSRGAADGGVAEVRAH